MQSRYDHGIDELISKQDSQLAMTKEDEIDCRQGQFRLHILQQRLRRHQQWAEKSYAELARKLNEDSRLKEPYIVR
jgi:hypothetical protein